MSDYNRGGVTKIGIDIWTLWNFRRGIKVSSNCPSLFIFGLDNAHTQCVFITIHGEFRYFANPCLLAIFLFWQFGWGTYIDPTMHTTHQHKFAANATHFDHITIAHRLHGHNKSQVSMLCVHMKKNINSWIESVRE